MVAAHHQLSVIDDVEAEDDTADAGVDKIDCSAAGKEGGNQAKDDETHQNRDQNTFQSTS